MNKEGKVFDTSGAIIKARREFISLHNYFYSISIPFNDIVYIILRVITINTLYRISQLIITNTYRARRYQNIACNHEFLVYNY